MNSSPTMRRSIISSVEVEIVGSDAALRQRRASLRGRRLARAGTMPMRSSIVCVSSSVTGISNATSRAANHICLWPASSSQPGFVARVRFEQAALRGAAIAVPSMLSTK